MVVNYCFYYYCCLNFISEKFRNYYRSTQLKDGRTRIWTTKAQPQCGRHEPPFCLPHPSSLPSLLSVLLKQFLANDPGIQEILVKLHLHGKEADRTGKFLVTDTEVIVKDLEGFFTTLTLNMNFDLKQYFCLFN